MRIVCISDTHGRKFDVPDGDVLIHAGDLTMQGGHLAVVQVGFWLADLPHKHKIVIAGNHDYLFERDYLRGKEAIGHGFNGVTYLQDETVSIDGLNFYGSPWQPKFFDWAFNVDRGPKIAEKWARIPEATEVLITHGPPHGILDLLPHGDRVGCEELAKRIEFLPSLKLHVFGHIHCGYGRLELPGRIFVNAAICDEEYRARNKPIVVDL